MKPKIILTTAAIVIIVAIIIAGVVLLPKLHFSMPKQLLESATVQPGYYKVTRVSDGDTFDVNMDGNTETVRMIGVDTPETVKPNSPPECCWPANRPDWRPTTVGKGGVAV